MNIFVKLALLENFVFFGARDTPHIWLRDWNAERACLHTEGCARGYTSDKRKKKEKDGRRSVEVTGLLQTKTLTSHFKVKPTVARKKERANLAPPLRKRRVVQVKNE